MVCSLRERWQMSNYGVSDPECAIERGSGVKVKALNQWVFCFECLPGLRRHTVDVMQRDGALGHVMPGLTWALSSKLFSSLNSCSTRATESPMSNSAASISIRPSKETFTLKTYIDRLVSELTNRYLPVNEASENQSVKKPQANVSVVPNAWERFDSIRPDQWYLSEVLLKVAQLQALLQFKVMFGPKLLKSIFSFIQLGQQPAKET